MLFKSIIFDLDGTLIDSQKSILDSISVALNESNLKPRIFLTKELIGPPLIDLISKIFLQISRFFWDFLLKYQSFNAWKQ
jgi:phosphoglycolate phosphatase-like HAD superfamily hydrolase